MIVVSLKSQSLKTHRRLNLMTAIENKGFGKKHPRNTDERQNNQNTLNYSLTRVEHMVIRAVTELHHVNES